MSEKTQRGNYFEDFTIGQEIVHATPRTVTDGDVALYVALYGSRFAATSAETFARDVGYPRMPVDALLAFQERLARCPEQCARHGGPACWPGRAPPRFPACPACGGARAAELVLTPGLHAALLEGEGAEFAGGWTAAAVGACGACGGWAEEAVAVACVE